MRPMLAGERSVNVLRSRHAAAAVRAGADTRR
jgi:hypothetical protein